MYDLAFAKGGETTRPSIQIRTRRHFLELAEVDMSLQHKVEVYSGRIATMEYLKDPNNYGYEGSASVSEVGNGEVVICFPAVPEKRIGYRGRPTEEEVAELEEVQINQAGRASMIRSLTSNLNYAHEMQPNRYPEPIIELSTSVNLRNRWPSCHRIKAIIAKEVSGLVDLMTGEQRSELEAEIRDAISSYGYVSLDSTSVRADIRSGESMHFDCPGDACGLDSQYSIHSKKVEFVGHNVDTAAQQLMLLAGLAVIPTYLNKA
jgi:hypothetical protein